jgi:hypothetical protein
MAIEHFVILLPRTFRSELSVRTFNSREPISLFVSDRYGESQTADIWTSDSFVPSLCGTVDRTYPQLGK